MKKYIKRIWFTVAAVILALVASLVETWWRGEQDHDSWDFWNH